MKNTIKVSEQIGFPNSSALKINGSDSIVNRISLNMYNRKTHYTNKEPVYKNTIVPRSFLPQ